MNKDIVKYLEYINKSAPTRKRKLDHSDLVNEINCVCIENLINILQQNKSKNVMRFLSNFKTGLIESKDSIYVESETNLLIIASISTLIDLIKMVEVEYSKCNTVNIRAYLIDYKNSIDIPKKCRKLDQSIQFTTDGYILDDFVVDDSEYETTDDEDEDEDEDEDISSDKMTSNFLNSLKHLSNGSIGSKEEVIQYFQRLASPEQSSKIAQLDELVNDNTTPSIFRILDAPIKEENKKTIISKILSVSNNISENGKMKKWLDEAIKIPFGVYQGVDLKTIKPTKVTKFIKKLIESMDKAVWGHDDAKKEIVQIVAQQIRNNDCKGSVIGLWGPPGTGKTSLIKDGIAKAMNKPFVFISLGGASDSSFLDGHSFTYEGSICGRIAQAIIDSKCMNPIIYFDELDKVSATRKGEEIINLLVHLIDPAQNKLFRDKYFYDIDLDMSKVTFIFSFNDPSNVNYILKDRITLIETKHITFEQKLHIVSNYLMPEILKDVGLEQNSIVIPTDIIARIVTEYTNEGGIRGLKKHLYRIIRELNVSNLTNTIQFPLHYTLELFNSHFDGKHKYNHLTVHIKDGIGMVNGLWANSLGVGGVLPIESVLIPTKELMGVKATGSLGNVIKESIDVALSVAWNRLDPIIQEQWMSKWAKTPECFHIHCPDGSTNKEGPSAGAAMSLAFYSRLTNRMVRHNVAMTGEINLRGEVTEIGGLEEKLSAAKLGGAIMVLIPRENEMDLIEIKKRYPRLIDDNFVVQSVDSFDKVIEYSLL